MQLLLTPIVASWALEFLMMNINSAVLLDKIVNFKMGQDFLQRYLILFLVEFKRRRLFLNLGYGSLFDFLTTRLKYNRAQTYLLAAISEACLKDEIIKASFFKEELMLESAIEIYRVISDKRLKITTENKLAIIRLCVGASRNDTLNLIEKYILTLSENCFKSPPDREEIQNKIIKRKRRWTVILTRDLEENLGEVRGRLSHKYPNGIMNEELAQELFCSFLNSDPINKPAGRDQKNRSVINHDKRYIPIHLRRQIWQRGGGRCEFLGSDGLRCNSNWQVELHHIDPFCLGGEHSANNLMLLCKKHNWYEADKIKAFL